MNRLSILFISLLLASIANLLQGQNNAYNEPTLFWTHASGAIRSMVPGDSTFKDIIPNDTPWDMKIDRKNGKLFWIASLKYIRRANLDGSNVETIIDFSCEESPCNQFIEKISVDSENEKIYWVSSTRQDSSMFFIERANLDGSDAEFLFSPGGNFHAFPNNSLTIVPTINKLYWLENNILYSSNTDGTNQLDHILTDGSPADFVFSSDWKDIYFLYYDGRITRADLTGQEQETISLGVDASIWQSHLTLEPLEDRLYWIAPIKDPDYERFLYSINTDGTDRTRMKLGSNIYISHNYIEGLAVDENSIYWSIRHRDIYKSNHDATETTNLIESTNTGDIRGFSFNPVERKLYWYEPSKYRIRRSDENGDNIENVITDFTSDTELIDMVIDRKYQKLYWTQLPSYADLYCANLDGSEIEFYAEINSSSSDWRTTLAIDDVQSKIYYKITEHDIYSIDLNTKLITKIYNSDGYIYQISVFPNKFLFWHESNDSHQSFYRSELDGTSIEKFNPPISNYPYIAIDPLHEKIYWTAQQGFGIEQWGIARANLDFTDWTGIIGNEYNNGPSIEMGIGYIGEIVLDTELPTSIESTKSIPNSFTLEQNYPNPFNPSTVIKYQIPNNKLQINSNTQISNNVTLSVFDILGREVAILVNKKQKPGFYEVSWDARNQPSGVYFYNLQVGDFTETKKMILLR